MWNYLIFFVGEYSSVWPEICRVLSRIQCRLLRGILGKKIFREKFSKFFSQTKAILQTCEISPYFLQFFFCVRTALKKFTQVLSYVSCTHVRSDVHKRITKRRYGKEKPGRFVFRITSFFQSRSRCYLCLTPWVILSEIFTRLSSLCLLSFGWDLSPRFVPQDWQ